MKSRGKGKGLIYDFNGFLGWGDNLRRNSCRRFAAQLQAEPLSDNEIDIHVHWRNGKYTLEYVLGHTIGAQKAAKLMDLRKLTHWQMDLNLDGGSKLSSGVIPLLDDQVKWKIPHTIATASEQNPDQCLRATQNLGVKTVVCVAVEDSFSGVQAAHAAGIGWGIALRPLETHGKLFALLDVDHIL